MYTNSVSLPEKLKNGAHYPILPNSSATFKSAVNAIRDH